MKAFVIKNKEGKYYQDKYYMPAFTDDLFIANKYQSIEETKKILNKSLTLVDNFEPVEVTIAEGDLEQENKQLKEQLTERNVDYWEYQDKICKGEHIGILEKENTVLKKALKLACADSDNYWYEKKALKRKMSLYDYFIEQAKESMK